MQGANLGFKITSDVLRGSTAGFDSGPSRSHGHGLELGVCHVFGEVAYTKPHGTHEEYLGGREEAGVCAAERGRRGVIWVN